jgi:hypothetical protein
MGLLKLNKEKVNSHKTIKMAGLEAGDFKISKDWLFTFCTYLRAGGLSLNVPGNSI